MKTLVLFSGGLDSTVLLYHAVNKYGVENVAALSLSYGQKHIKELEYSEWTCNHLGVVRYAEDLSRVFTFNPDVCSLLQASKQDIATGAYSEQCGAAAGKPVATYVPYRNGLFLSYAAAVALQLGAKNVLYGAHRDDAAGEAYPDCSPAFVNAQKNAIFEGTGHQICVAAPWVNINKAAIVAEGIRLGMTHEEFEHTWSCYNGQHEPCKICGTCIDRKNAFMANDIFDID